MKDRHNFIEFYITGKVKRVPNRYKIVLTKPFRHQTDPTFLYRNINYQRKDLKLKKQKSRTTEAKGEF